jgi:hypothetical protein
MTCSGTGAQVQVSAESLYEWISQSAMADTGDCQGSKLEEIRQSQAYERDQREANEIIKAATIFSLGDSTLIRRRSFAHSSTASPSLVMQDST